MKLFKTILVIIFFMFLMSVFMLNKNVELPVNYFGLSAPLKVDFWQLVTVCVALGVFISALWDFFTELKWRRERRKMIQTHNEHVSVEAGLKARIEELETENERLRRETDRAPRPAAPPAGPPKEAGLAARPGQEKPAITLIGGKTDTLAEKAASKDEVGPQRTGLLSGLGRRAASKDANDTPAGSTSPAPQEPPKKAGFLSRFKGGSSSASPATPDKAPTAPPEKVEKAAPTAAEPGDEKRPGLQARFGKTPSAEPASGIAEPSLPGSLPLPPSKPAPLAGQPLPGADPKVEKSSEKESPDQPKRDS
ncbi:MAG: hypothetical protein AB1646_23760 [Thermodesulfobacteriota bacterium]